MEKNRKKIRIVFWCVVVAIFFTLGVCSAAFSLSGTVVCTLYWLSVLGIMITYFAINQLWYREFMSGVNALLPILTEAEDPDRYVAELEALLIGKKSPQIIGTLRVNISMAFCEKGDYPEAKRQLLTVKPQKLHGMLRVIYLADYAYVEFHLGNDDAALSLMAQNSRGLEAFQNSAHLGATISILRVFELLAKQELDRAKALYESARERFEDDRTRGDFETLQMRLGV